MIRRQLRSRNRASHYSREKRAQADKQGEALVRRGNTAVFDPGKRSEYPRKDATKRGKSSKAAYVTANTKTSTSISSRLSIEWARSSRTKCCMIHSQLSRQTLNKKSKILIGNIEVHDAKLEKSLARTHVLGRLSSRNEAIRRESDHWI